MSKLGNIGAKLHRGEVSYDFFGHGHKLSGLDPEHLGVERLPGQTKPSARPAKPSSRPKPVGGEV